jgi:hypothetical protein
MGKESDYDYVKLNISVIICDTNIRSGLPGLGCDRKTSEVMTSLLEAVQHSIKEILTGTKGSGISDQLRNMSFN